MQTHSPIAHKVVCVDFDATLFAWGEIDELTSLMPGAVEVVNALKDEGWRIVIFTSRLSPTWLKAAYGDDWNYELMAQKSFITHRLTLAGIPFDDITCEKIPAVAYIDDKAIEFTGYNWYRIGERLLMEND